MYEYQAAKLHTKLAIVDDVVHVGSANLDFRSLFINMEVVLRVDDPTFAAAMRSYFEREIREQRADHAGAASAARNLVAPAQVDDLVLAGDVDGLHRHPTAELHRALVARFAHSSSTPRTGSRAGR